MKYLLDTVAWLWSVHADERLGDEARAIQEKGGRKRSTSRRHILGAQYQMRFGKLNLPGPPARVVPAFMAKQGLLSIAVTHLHAVKVYDFPSHHSDPFDRLIIAQAIIEEMGSSHFRPCVRKIPDQRDQGAGK